MQICSGRDHTVLLRSGGRIVACGFNEHGQCDIPSAEAGGEYHLVGPVRDCRAALRRRRPRQLPHSELSQPYGGNARHVDLRAPRALRTQGAAYSAGIGPDGGALVCRLPRWELDRGEKHVGGVVAGMSGEQRRSRHVLEEFCREHTHVHKPLGTCTSSIQPHFRLWWASANFVVRSTGCVVHSTEFVVHSTAFVVHSTASASTSRGGVKMRGVPVLLSFDHPTGFLECSLDSCARNSCTCSYFLLVVVCVRALLQCRPHSREVALEVFVVSTRAGSALIDARPLFSMVEVLGRFRV